jgi:hypothetical protein
MKKIVIAPVVLAAFWFIAAALAHDLSIPKVGQRPICIAKTQTCSVQNPRLDRAVPRWDGHNFTSTAQPLACSTAWQKRDTIG